MLPAELLEKILLSVSVKDAIVLSRTSIQWNDILTSTRYWLIKGRKMGCDLTGKDFQYHQHVYTPVIAEISRKRVTYGSERYQKVNYLIERLLKNNDLLSKLNH